MYTLTERDLDFLKVYEELSKYLWQLYANLTHLDFLKKKDSIDFSEHIKKLKEFIELEDDVKKYLFSSPKKIDAIIRFYPDLSKYLEISQTSVMLNSTRKKMFLNRLSKAIEQAKFNSGKPENMYILALSNDISRIALAILNNESTEEERGTALEVSYIVSFAFELLEKNYVENNFDFTSPVYLTSNIVKASNPVLKNFELTAQIIRTLIFSTNLTGLLKANDSHFNQNGGIHLLVEAANLRASIALLSSEEAIKLIEEVELSRLKIENKPNMQKINALLIKIRDSYEQDRSLINRVYNLSSDESYDQIACISKK